MCVFLSKKWTFIASATILVCLAEMSSSGVTVIKLEQSPSGNGTDGTNKTDVIPMMRVQQPNLNDTTTDDSRRNDRFFWGYPFYGYGPSSYFAYGGYPYRDSNGLVTDFHRLCAEAYPNRRYSCYGTGR
jgi:hypothetical protein